MFILAKLKVIEPAVLAGAMKQAVAAFDGLTERTTTLECRRLTRDFSVDEQAQLQAVYDAHDALAIRAAQQARRQLVEQEYAKVPGTLTLPERVRRLEILGGVD